MPAARGLDLNEAELAAAAFLARYQGRTLDAYRYDLRAFFQWATDEGLDVLAATRPQIESYARAMESRGLAATTIDRRLSRSAASTGSPTSTAASRRTRPSTSAAPRFTHPSLAASIGQSSAPSSSPPSASTASTQPSRSSSGSTAYG
jgi:hypothetical protein